MTGTLVEPTTLKARGPWITEPGVYPDVDEADYHRDPVVGGSLSSTGARTLVHRTPAHFDHERREGRAPKSQFDVGSAFHTLLLGRGADIVTIDADSYSTKAARQQRDAAYDAGHTPLLVEQYAQVKAMVAAVHRHPVAAKLFARDGQAEVTVVARDPETGVMCRARFDWLVEPVPGQPVLYVDAKTCENASEAAMAKSMTSWGYNLQCPFYEDTLIGALDLDVPVRGVLMFIEKEPPHLIGFGQPDEQSLAWGRRQNRKARDLYRTCTERGAWPGYPEHPVSLSLPGWHLNNLEAADAAGAYDIEGDQS